MKAKDPEYKTKPAALRNAKNKMREEVAKEALTTEEQAFMKAAISNAAYH